MDPPAVPDRLVLQHHRALAAGVGLVFGVAELAEAGEVASGPGPVVPGGLGQGGGGVLGAHGEQPAGPALLLDDGGVVALPGADPEPRGDADPVVAGPVGEGPPPGRQLALPGGGGGGGWPGGGGLPGRRGGRLGRLGTRGAIPGRGGRGSLLAWADLGGCPGGGRGCPILGGVGREVAGQPGGQDRAHNQQGSHAKESTPGSAGWGWGRWEDRAGWPLGRRRLCPRRLPRRLVRLGRRGRCGSLWAASVRRDRSWGWRCWGCGGGRGWRKGSGTLLSLGPEELSGRRWKGHDPQPVQPGPDLGAGG